MGQLKGATSLNMLRTRRLGCSLFRRNSLTGERLLLESNMCLLNEQMLGYSRSACGGNIAPGGEGRVCSRLLMSQIQMYVSRNPDTLPRRGAVLLRAVLSQRPLGVAVAIAAASPRRTVSQRELLGCKLTISISLLRARCQNTSG